MVTWSLPISIVVGGDRASSLIVYVSYTVLPIHTETMPSLPAIENVPSCSTEERARVLDTLFETCTQLHTLSVETLGETKFDSYSALIEAVGRQLQSLYESKLESDQKWLDDILAAHPRLGEKKVDSEQSRSEQAQLNQGDSSEGEKLAKLNQEYEEKFPGLRYV